MLILLKQNKNILNCVLLLHTKFTAMQRTLIICILLFSFGLAKAQVDPNVIEIVSNEDSIIFKVDGKESSIANTDMAAYYLSMGLEAALENDFASAEDKFRVALLYDLENPEILYNLGLAQFFQEDYYTAIKTFDAAAQFDPENKEIYNQRALCKAMNGDYEDAETDFKIMLKYDPAFPMGIYNYGILMLQMGEMETACELLNKSDSYGYEKAPEVIATYCNGYGN